MIILRYFSSALLKAEVVGVPICFHNRLMYSPTTSPYGDSSFPKEENGDRFASKRGFTKVILI